MTSRQSQKNSKFLSAKPKIMGFALWPTVVMGGISVGVLLASFFLRSMIVMIIGTAMLAVTYWYITTIKRRRFVLDEMIMFFFAPKEITSACFFNKKHFGRNDENEE